MSFLGVSQTHGKSNYFLFELTGLILKVDSLTLSGIGVHPFLLTILCNILQLCLTCVFGTAFYSGPRNLRSAPETCTSCFSTQYLDGTVCTSAG